MGPPSPSGTPSGEPLGDSGGHGQFQWLSEEPTGELSVLNPCWVGSDNFADPQGASELIEDYYAFYA
jgi:hypothetical protein